jgi:hypothetical protein
MRSAGGGLKAARRASARRATSAAHTYGYYRDQSGGSAVVRVGYAFRGALKVMAGATRTSTKAQSSGPDASDAAAVNFT